MTMSTKPELVRAEFQYTQEEDTSGRSGVDNQYITVTAESVPVLLGEPRFYLVIQTERWAVNGPEEIVELLKDVERRIAEPEDHVSSPSVP